MYDAMDYRIAQVIDDYVEKARANGIGEGVDLITAAFEKIKKDRQSKCLSDEVTVCAEHYLCARDFSGDLLVVGHIASLGYDAIKALGGSKAVGLLGNDCPVSPVTIRQTEWKLKGNNSGSADAILRTRRIKSVVVEMREEEAFQEAADKARGLKRY